MSSGTTSGKAYARAGLVGNPSDGYGGRVIAMTVPNFEAEVRFVPGSKWTFGSSPGSELLAATVRALKTRRPELLAQPGQLLFASTIPRQVGLSGSSAIIIAALRALAAQHELSWDPTDLARVALEVETDELGWAAGPQDRVVQVMEGLVDMDFAEPWRPEGYKRLDASLLPPLFLAWHKSTGARSDVVHSTVRQRWIARDPEVVSVMKCFAELAAGAREALDSNSAAAIWPRSVERGVRLTSPNLDHHRNRPSPCRGRLVVGCRCCLCWIWGSGCRSGPRRCRSCSDWGPLRGARRRFLGAVAASDLQEVSADTPAD